MIHRFIIRDFDAMVVTTHIPEGPSAPLDGHLRLMMIDGALKAVLELNDTGLTPAIVEAIRVQCEGKKRGRPRKTP